MTRPWWSVIAVCAMAAWLVRDMYLESRVLIRYHEGSYLLRSYASVRPPRLNAEAWTDAVGLVEGYWRDRARTLAREDGACDMDHALAELRRRRGRVTPAVAENDLHVILNLLVRAGLPDHTEFSPTPARRLRAILGDPTASVAVRSDNSTIVMK